MALVLGLVLLLPAAWAVSQAVGTYAEQARREAEALGRTAAQVSARQAELIARARMLLERVAALPEVAAPGADPAACSALLAAEAGGEEGRAFADLVAADASGRAACASRPDLVGLDLSGRPWFREARGRGGFVVGDLRTAADPALGRALVLAAPLRAGGGGAEGGPVPRFAGTLSGDLAPGPLAAVPAGLELPGGAVVRLVDDAGRPAFPPPDPAGGEGATPGGPAPGGPTLPRPAEVARLLASPLSATALADGPSGRTRFAAAPVEPGRLHALVGLPAPLWSWLERDLLIGVIAPVLMLALAVTGIWIATDYLVNRHVQALAAAARDYAQGRHAGWPALRGAPSELRQLSAVLARVTAELGAREADLKASLAQKEVLLREVHHRVKNNLQVVTSLLNLRAQAASSPAARAAMLEAQSRVKALALAHRDMYEGEEVGSVELQPFLAELCALLEDTAPGWAAAGAAAGGGGAPPGEVELRLRLDPAPARVGIDRAVPVALFVAEALGNAFKHAFPGGRAGVVTVRLARVDGGRAARLAIGDDGVGLGAGAGGGGGAGGRPSGLGMTLMRMLAGQAGGRLAVESGPPGDGGGTRVELEFPLAGPEAGPAAAPAQAPPAPAPPAATAAA